MALLASVAVDPLILRCQVSAKGIKKALILLPIVDENESEIIVSI